MKKALLFAVAIICLASCTKDGIVSPGFFGKYELRASYGGLTGFSETYEPGNGNVFQFNSDSTYVHYSGSKSQDSGKFRIKITGTEGDAKFGTISLTDLDYQQAFRIKGDTITIGTTITDGIASDFVKIN